MKKLNICIDIDGTVTDPYYFIEYFNDHFNKDLKEEDMNTCKLEDLYDTTLEEILEFYTHKGYDIHLSANPLDSSSEIIHELNKKHNLYFVTARNEGLKDVTEEWMRVNNFPKIKVYYLGGYYKVDKARELDCDLFIEDNPQNTEDLAKSGIQVLLMDANYNKDIKLENVTRVMNWNEIENIIDTMSLSKS
ncbi:5' nucleotidase, NT5C type [Tepidibacter mesophilus]|uniref:5' nucleotidase, NT5C type n=1 Tax=Tepidibacter mesophilus TaxID=655607 RepID=UPI000C07EB14|nr:hypothetical protein [Tepidibacter mesophilus]